MAPTTGLASSAVAADVRSLSSIISSLNGKLPSLFPPPTDPPPSNSLNQSVLSSEMTSSYPENSPDESKVGAKLSQTDCKSANLCPNESIRFFPRMVLMEPMHELPSINHFLNRLGKSKRYSEIFWLYGEMKSAGRFPDLFTLNILLYCFCDANRVRDGLVVVGKILRSGYSPNIKTFNSLIMGLFIGRRGADAVELFLKSEKYGCCPDANTCRRLITGLCRSGHASDALRIHEEIVSGKGEYGWCGLNASYSCIIEGLCEGGMEDTAMKLFLEMKGKGLSPTIVHHNALMNGFCRVGKLKEAMSLFNEMLDASVRPNAVTFSVLTNVFRKAGNTKAVKWLLEEMMTGKGENHPDNIVYATFMNELCLAENLSELLKSMPSISYNVLINRHCKNGRIEEALNLCHWMLQKQIKPNKTAYNTLLRELFWAGKVHDGKKLFENILADNLGPDASTFCICIDGFCKNDCTLEAMEFLRELESFNFELNIKIFNCMMYWLCKAGKLEASWELFNSLSEKCVKPNLVTYTIMISGMCKGGQLEKVNDLFLNMENQGCAPPIINYNTILCSFVENDQFEKAVEVLHKMVEKKVSPDVWTRFYVFDMLLKDGKYDDRLHLLPTFPAPAEECDMRQQCYEGMLWQCDATLFVNERQCRRHGSMGTRANADLDLGYLRLE